MPPLRGLPPAACQRRLPASQAAARRLYRKRWGPELGARAPSRLQAAAAGPSPIGGPLTEEEFFRDDLIEEGVKRLAQIGNLEDLFRKADVNGNGVLEKGELKALLQSTDGGLQPLTFDWLSDAEVTTVLQKYDWDQSGDISYDEFQALVKEGVLLEGTLAQYERVFQEAGGPGMTWESLQELFKRLGQPIQEDQLEAFEARFREAGEQEISFPRFLELFRADLLELEEVLAFLRLDTATELRPDVQKEAVGGQVTLLEAAEEFEAVLGSVGERLVVLEASLTWCRPCKGFQRAYEKFADAYQEARFLKVFGNANPSCKRLFKERLRTPLTPTFTFWRGGEAIHQQTGANREKLFKALESHLLPHENPLEGANAFKRQVFAAKLGVG